MNVGRGGDRARVGNVQKILFQIVDPKKRKGGALNFDLDRKHMNSE